MCRQGSIGQTLFENLLLNGIQLVAKVKNNMRNSLMSIADRILLRKRVLIETVNDELKNIAQIEHSKIGFFFFIEYLFRQIPLTLRPSTSV